VPEAIASLSNYSSNSHIIYFVNPQFIKYYLFNEIPAECRIYLTDFLLPQEVMLIKFSRFKSLFFFGVALCIVMVCGLALGQASLAQSSLAARVDLVGADITGTLILTQQENGLVRIRGTIQGDPATLTPGLHGLHIHSVGVCEPGAQPPFSTSGGHFDPGPFGSEVPVEANHPYHLGDLPNLLVDV
jgi:superoxide dismutase, Cu-Zn family